MEKQLVYPVEDSKAPLESTEDDSCTIALARIEAADEETVENGEPKDLLPLPTPVVSTYVLPKFDKVPSLGCKLVDTLVQASWQPVRACPGWFARLRSIRKNEPRDIAEQSHVFELKCPSLTPVDTVSVVPNLRYLARRAYERLKPAQRQSFDTLSHEYISRQWWIERSEAELKALTKQYRLLDPAVVFLVPGKLHRSDRLVVDLRRANSRIPRATSSPLTVATCVCTSRLYGSSFCCVLDISRAFYRLRLYAILAVLLVGSRLFTSDRCTFGISSGPGNLGGSFGWLLSSLRDLCRSEDLTALLSEFMDDLQCSGPDGSWLVCVLLWVLAGCGFPAERKKFQAMATSEAQLSAGNALKKMGLPGDFYEWQDSVTILGTLQKYTADGKYLVVSCLRSSRLTVAADQANALIDGLTGGGDPFILSKSGAFSLGGNLSYDCCGCHPVDRVLADALRSVIARHYAEVPWTTKFDLRTLPDPYRTAILEIARWIRAICTSSTECQHESPLRNHDDPIILEVASDASATGAAYVINILHKKGGDDEEIQRYQLSAAAWRFTAQQRHYHSNRRELAACCKAIQAAADVISHLDSKVAGSLPPIEIRVVSDNRPTVAWLTGSGAISKSALERRAVLRTLNALKDEVDYLRSIGTVSISHICGSDNSEVDQLSRLFDKEIRLESGSRMTLADALLGGADEKQDLSSFPDVFDSGAVQGPGLSWILEEDTTITQDTLDVFWILPEIPRYREYFEENAQVLAAVNRSEDRLCIIETLCGNAYDAYTVLVDFQFLREVFRAMLPQYRKQELSRTLGGAERQAEENWVCFHRALQSDLAATVWPAGPYCIDSDGIICFRNGQADGTIDLLPVVPKRPGSCAAYRKKVLRDAHRATAHGGVGATVAHVYTQYYMPEIRVEAKKLVKYCYCCQTLRARRQWSQLPGVPDKSSAIRAEPYTEVFIDFLTLGELRGSEGPTKILTVYCLGTSHSTWVPCSERMADVLRALVRVQQQEGGIRLIRTDRAAYFRSKQFAQEAARVLHANVALMTARSPWRSGGGERIHSLGLRVARVLLRGSCGTRRSRQRQKVEIDLEYVCREVTLLLNTRPLSFTTSHEPDGQLTAVTPDLLARGYTRRRGCFCGAALGNLSSVKRAKAARSHFMAQIYKDMRIAAAKAMGHKGAKKPLPAPTVGDPVLIYHPTRKMASGFRLAHVSKIEKNGRQIQVKNEDGSEDTHHHYNVVPIKIDPSLNSDDSETDLDAQQGGHDVNP